MISRIPYKKSTGVPSFYSLGPTKEQFVGDSQVLQMVAPRNMPSSSYSENGINIVEPTYFPSVMDVNAFLEGMKRLNYPRVLWDYDEYYDLIRDLIDVTFGPFWVGCEVLTYEEACEISDKTKSPAYPYYYMVNTLGQLLERYPELLRKDVMTLFTDDPVTYPNTPTLKDELLHYKKVFEVIKTRLFYNCSRATNMASKMLFHNQNEALTNNVLKHPCAIGLDLPGPGFVQMYSKLHSFAGGKPQCGDDDVKGWDMTYQPLISNAIQSVRKDYLPESYSTAVQNCYSLAFLGYLVCGGYIIAQPPLMPSGWENTAHDNSIGKYCGYFVIFIRLNPQFKGFEIRAFKMYFYPFTGGDDGIYAVQTEYVFWKPEAVIKVGAELGIFLEMTSEKLNFARECYFFSHTLKTIVFRGVTYWVPCGKLEKILSAMTYRHRTNPALTVARLYGLCNQLFPYPLYRQFCLEEVDNWVAHHPRNKVNDKEWIDAKKNRLNNDQLLEIYVGW